MGGDKGFHTFPKGMRLKLNVIVRWGIELISYNVEILHVSLYAMETSTKRR